MDRQRRIIPIICISLILQECLSILHIIRHDYIRPLDCLPDIIQRQLRQTTLKIIFMLILIQIFKGLSKRPVDMFQILPAVSQHPITSPRMQHHPQLKCKVAVS